MSTVSSLKSIKPNWNVYNKDRRMKDEQMIWKSWDKKEAKCGENRQDLHSVISKTKTPSGIFISFMRRVIAWIISND